MLEQTTNAQAIFANMELVSTENAHQERAVTVTTSYCIYLVERSLAKPNAQYGVEGRGRERLSMTGPVNYAGAGVDGMQSDWRKQKCGVGWLKRGRLGRRHGLRTAIAAGLRWIGLLVGIERFRTMRALHLGSRLCRRLDYRTAPAPGRHEEERRKANKSSDARSHIHSLRTAHQKVPIKTARPLFACLASFPAALTPNSTIGSPCSSFKGMTKVVVHVCGCLLRSSNSL